MYTGILFLAYVSNDDRLNIDKLGEVRIGPFNIKKNGISSPIYKVDFDSKHRAENFFHSSKLVPHLIPVGVFDKWRTVCVEIIKK